MQRAERTGRAVLGWSVAVAALATLAVLTVLLHSSGAYPATITATAPVAAVQDGPDHDPACAVSSFVSAVAAPLRSTTHECADPVAGAPVQVVGTPADRLAGASPSAPRAPVPAGSMLIALGIDRS